MQNEPLISVIIPTYNRGRLILDSVNSVLNQTYKNIELIVVDDCSTDDTEEILKSINDSRIRYEKLEKNSGACIARNRGIELSTGEFIAFNDSDDSWHSNKLEKQLNFLTRNCADVVSCSMSVYDDEKNERLFEFPDSKLAKEGFVSCKALLKYNSTSTQLLFGKTECFKKIFFDPQMPRFQDWEECIRLSKDFGLYHQDKILVDTFIQPDSITKNPQKGVRGMEMLFEKHKDAILSDPEIVESFFRKKASFVCKTGKNPKEEMKMIFKYNPTAKNFIKYSLSAIGVYKYIFNIKQKF